MELYEKFAEEVRKRAVDAAVDDVLEGIIDPPGRSPHQCLVRWNQWWQELTDSEREMLREIVRDAAMAAAFGIFVIIDGARTTELPFDRYEIVGIADGERVTINPSWVDLHDFFAMEEGS